MLTSPSLYIYLIFFHAPMLRSISGIMISLNPQYQPRQASLNPEGRRNIRSFPRRKQWWSVDIYIPVPIPKPESGVWTSMRAVFLYIVCAGDLWTGGCPVYCTMKVKTSYRDGNQVRYQPICSVRTFSFFFHSNKGIITRKNYTFTYQSKNHLSQELVHENSSYIYTEI